MSMLSRYRVRALMGNGQIVTKFSSSELEQVWRWLNKPSVRRWNNRRNKWIEEVGFPATVGYIRRRTK